MEEKPAALFSSGVPVSYRQGLIISAQAAIPNNPSATDKDIQPKGSRTWPFKNLDSAPGDVDIKYRQRPCREL